MEHKILIHKYFGFILAIMICLGILSQGINIYAENSVKSVKRAFSSYSKEELDAMTEEEYWAVLEDANGVDYTEDEIGDINVPRTLPEKNVANAIFLRSYVEDKISTNPDKYGCMQNFAIFKQNNDTYIVRSMGGASGNAKLFIERRSYYGNNAMTFGATSYVNGQNKIVYAGHGDSIEVVEHSNSKYIMYISGTYDTELGVIRGPYYLKCRQLLFDNAGDVSLGIEKTLSLFETFNGSSAWGCKLAASENYICICISYGTGIRKDRERYMIYSKNDFIDALYNGATSQLNTSIQNCRYATGWFLSTDSIGYIIPFSRTVIQSLGLDEKKDDNGELQDFIVFAAIDDRGTGGSSGTNGHKIHLINRAYIEPKTPGSQESKTAQNMKEIKCYYSKITHISYSVNGNYYEYDLNSSMTNLTIDRPELEGLKKIKAQGNGITYGWYVSTHNRTVSDCLPNVASVPYFDNMPNYLENTVPWNSMIYKVQMTPVQVWNGN
ncbi:MAG: hypothetical protein E7571_03855 [Ruminococcaceae bacterium]|nr:hypothetical protein [Oscillospiraceae bacterium]